VIRALARLSIHSFHFLCHSEAIKVEPSFFVSQIALETEFDNAPALALYTSLGFVPEKRLHRFYLNGKDAFRLVLPLAPRSASASSPSSSASSSSSSLVPEEGEDVEEEEEEDYAEDTAKLVRLRRRVAALRGCRMIAVWPADEEDRVSGR
jgi:peptide alpha-N-acetyltransferase